MVDSVRASGLLTWLLIKSSRLCAVPFLPITSTPPKALLIKLLPSADPMPPATAAVPPAILPSAPAAPLLLAAGAMGGGTAGAAPLAVAGAAVPAVVDVDTGGLANPEPYVTFIGEVPVAVGMLVSSFKGLRVIS